MSEGLGWSQSFLWPPLDAGGVSGPAAETIGPFERERCGVVWRDAPGLAQPILQAKAFDAGKFLFVVGDEGVTQRQRLRRHEQVIAALRLQLGRDVARAIDHIWSKRIVHRDVAPKNMMLRRGDLEAVLIDLGIARHLSESPLTAPGLTWGTYGYLSPEQCRAEPNLSCHSDVFSLGVSLQEALVGRHPTRGDQQILVTTPPKTSDLVPSSPAALAEVVDLMLSLRAPFRPLPAALVIRFADLAASL